MSFRMRNSNVDIVKVGPTLIEQAYDAILAAICDGRLAPGARLNEADMRFHLWICRVAGNPLLAETMRLYWNHLRRAMAAVLRDPRHRTEIWDEHDAILEAIVANDAAGASHRAAAHAREAGKTVARSLPATHVGPGTARRVVALSDEPQPASRRHKSSS